MMPSPVTNMLSNKGSHSIYGTVPLLVDITNGYHDKETEQSPNVTKKWMSLNNLPLNLDPIDNYDGIILNKNPLNLQQLSLTNDADLSSTKLPLWG